MQQDRFHQLMSDRVGRVQRGHRVLEDDRDLVAANGLHDRFAGVDQLLPVQFDGAGDDLAGGGEDLHDRIRGNGFSGSALADDAEDLAAVQIEGYAVDGLDLACGREEGGVEITYFQ